MSEGVTLLIIISMLAAGSISVVMADRKDAEIRNGDGRQFSMLVACDLLFFGSFCVVLFHLCMENKINLSYLSLGWQIGLIMVLAAHLAFGVGRFWKLVLLPSLRKEHNRNSEMRKETSGYLQYALIYMSLTLLVILACEIFLCSIFPYIAGGKSLALMGVAVDWSDVREQLMGAVLICSLVGFVLSMLRTGQEYMLSLKETRRDKIAEVKQYLRQ